MSSLITIPLEVLERIALFVGSEKLSGPPKDLVSLFLTCRIIYDSLSLSCNPSLYASLFRYKFDIAAPLRRLSSNHTTAQCLAEELRTRFAAMQRIGKGLGSHVYRSTDRELDLWTAIVMMLENDGRNATQLRTFAKVQEWLHTYFFEPSGGSYIQRDMQDQLWPRANNDNTLALWLLCLLDADGTSPPCRLYSEILRAYAFGANRYPITQRSWNHFSFHDFTPLGTSVYSHFGRHLLLIPPPAAISAVSGYMARLRQPTSLIWPQPGEALLRDGQRQEASSLESDLGSRSQRWDCVWERCIGPGLGIDYVDPTNGLPRYFCPGTFDGSWEGLFTYAEFSTYAAMLAGEPPQIVTETAIGQNLQVWKIREYILYSSTSSPGPSDDPILPAGRVNHAFFPPSTLIHEQDHQATFTYSSQRAIYHRPLQATDEQSGQGILRDVIIIGEGHSSWGDFKLRGRIRPSDAFVTILKEYSGTVDRGSWLYRGHLLGGKFIGRWRDVLTPAYMAGYEGAFELTKRDSLQ